jgi:peptide deformylase
MQVYTSITPRLPDVIFRSIGASESATKIAAMADEVGEVRDEKLDAEAEARRRVALAQIRQYPDPALRMKAHDVESFDADLARLVEQLQHLLLDANGLGLAATQLGVLRRVFALRPDPEGESQILVNPRLVEGSDEKVSDEEGCLSLQGVVIPVERHERVTVEAQDAEGKDVRLELEGLPARVAQHELDHLDGILILDRTTPDARREALAVLRPQPVVIR